MALPCDPGENFLANSFHHYSDNCDRELGRCQQTRGRSDYKRVPGSDQVSHRHILTGVYASLSNAAHVLAALVLSFPFDLNEFLRSEPTTQLSLPSLKATPLTISGVIHWHELMES